MMQILFKNIAFILAKSVDSDEIRGPPYGGELGTCSVVPPKRACSP